jgi:methionyl aminopeptidase
MDRMTIKSTEELKFMEEGGALLHDIRQKVAEAVVPGITTLELENIADSLIKKAGGIASFKLVEGYKHATCININDVVVHGIPDMTKILDGDLVGIDVGMLYKGFHTDTSISVIAGKADKKVLSFLEAGKRALKKAIEIARPGKTIYDISMAMQKTIEDSGYSVVKALTGHGIGRNLHEEPAIPCFGVGSRDHSPVIKVGMALAIEVMYNTGTSEVVYKNDDGWTIVTADGKISGLFEETVAVTKNGSVVLT